MLLRGVPPATTAHCCFCVTQSRSSPRQRFRKYHRTCRSMVFDGFNTTHHPAHHRTSRSNRIFFVSASIYAPLWQIVCNQAVNASLASLAVMADGPPTRCRSVSWWVENWQAVAHTWWLETDCGCKGKCEFGNDSFRGHASVNMPSK